MTEPIRLRVYGTPIGQGSKRAIRNKHTGRIAMVEGRDRKAQEAFKTWREGVARAAVEWRGEHHAPVLEEPVAVTITFFIQKPASKQKFKWLPDVRPDWDKLARAVGDSLTGVIYADDSQVVVAAVGKRYAVDEPPGCEIHVWPLGAAERGAEPIGVELWLKPPAPLATVGTPGAEALPLDVGSPA